ncbi:MAG: hypothetical protein ACLTA9_06455 [Clostridium saudiense]
MIKYKKLKEKECKIWTRRIKGLTEEQIQERISEGKLISEDDKTRSN